jgi:hypothetical protein
VNVTLANAVAGLVSTGTLAALGGWVARAWMHGRKMARDVKVETARAAADEHIAEGREDTAQQRLAQEDAARVDSLAVETAKQEREERKEAQEEHLAALELVRALDRELAVCAVERTQARVERDNAKTYALWLKSRLDRIDGGHENNALIPPPPVPEPLPIIPDLPPLTRKTTPPGGTPAAYKKE